MIKALKKLIIPILLFIANADTYSQAPAFMGCTMNQNYFVSFGSSDNGEYNSFFILDTSQSTNIWQFGKSYKSVLNTNNSLMTDTLLPYRTNNYSSFKLGIITCGGIERNAQPYWFTNVIFYFSVETDFQKDGVVIETSRNNTDVWQNIILDPRISITPGWNSAIYKLSDTLSSANKPGYSGTLLQQTLAINIDRPTSVFLDTTWIKFSFYSDSVQTNKGGFSLNYLEVSPVFEGINTKSLMQELEISPNPTSGKIVIQNLPMAENSIVEIYSIHGNLLQRNYISEQGEIDISTMDPGIYLLKTSNKQKRILKF